MWDAGSAKEKILGVQNGGYTVTERKKYANPALG
jgi:hypothetical protein